MSLLKNVGVLTIGQAFAQAISLVGYVFLARLYAPDEFGVLALVLAISTMLSGVSSLQYEMTVLLAKTRRSANLGLSLSLCLSMSIHFFFILIVYLVSKVMIYDVGVWILAATISFLNSVQNISIFIQNREKRYKKTVVIMVFKNASFIVFSVLSWDADLIANGLICSYFVSSLLVALYLLCTEFQMSMILSMPRNRMKFRAWFLKYIDFFRFTTPAAFCSLAAQNVPVLLVALCFGEKAAGMYGMVQRVVMAPVGLISGAVNRVFLQKIGELRYKNMPVGGFTRATLKKVLFPVLFVCAVFVLFLRMDLLTLVFGDAWVGIDTFAAILVPVMAVSFMSKAVSGFAILGKNFVGMLYQLVLLFLVVTSVTLVYFSGGSVKYVYVALSISLSVAYLIQLYSILSITKSLDQELPKRYVV